MKTSTSKSTFRVNTRALFRFQKRAHGLPDTTTTTTTSTDPTTTLLTTISTKTCYK